MVNFRIQKLRINPKEIDSLPVWLVIFQRELADYFYTPIAYIFLIIFLALTSVSTFYLGNFLQTEQADLTAFFLTHVWLYLVLSPALGMRHWAEERKTGTIQALLTLPISIQSAVVGKFLASWSFTTLAILLTTPIWMTVNYLGMPDNGVILTAYFGSWLLAGSTLAVSTCMSATTQNQVVAFVLALVVNFIFTLGGFTYIENFLSKFLPVAVVDTIVGFNYQTHFGEFVKGVVPLASIVFMLSVTLLFIFLTVIVVQLRSNN